MLTVVAPQTRAPEREYAARVLLEEFLGLPVTFSTARREDTEIRVVGDRDRTLVIGDGLFSTADADWLGAPSLPEAPLGVLRVAGTPFRDHPGGDVPVLYGSPSWERAGSTMRIGADVFGSVFFLLTRYEELVTRERDDRDRFPARASVMARAGLLRRPLVNDYVELVWLALVHLWPALARRPLRFRVQPSHDVDWPLAGERDAVQLLRRTGADLVRERDPIAAARRVRGFAARRAGRRGADVNNTFDLIMDESERRGLRSAFYFIADHPAGDIDGTYALDDPWIRATLRRIHERGHEIGLHPSYTTYLDGARTRAERDLLVRACDAAGIVQERLGGRQHFLRWRNPETWRNWEGAQLDYDSTVGFADDAGFRAGVCLEYPVFDLEARRPLRLRELPLVAMEGAVLEGLGLGHDAAVATFVELRETCRRYGGTFTLLWHNHRLVHRADRRAYLEALGD